MRKEKEDRSDQETKDGDGEGLTLMRRCVSEPHSLIIITLLCVFLSLSLCCNLHNP